MVKINTTWCHSHTIRGYVIVLTQICVVFDTKSVNFDHIGRPCSPFDTIFLRVQSGCDRIWKFGIYLHAISERFRNSSLWSALDCITIPPVNILRYHSIGSWCPWESGMLKWITCLSGGSKCYFGKIIFSRVLLYCFWNSLFLVGIVRGIYSKLTNLLFFTGKKRIW